MTRKEFLIIAITTLITVIAWVGFDIYHKTQDSKIPPNVQQLITPVDPNFDTSSVQ